MHTITNSPSPHKSWRVWQSPGQTIHVAPPTPIKQGIRGDVIYCIKHEETGRRYIGSVKETKTNTLCKRFGRYKAKINHPEGKRLQPIERAILRSPEKFKAKIVAHCPGISERKLHILEERVQDLYDTRNPLHGYNKTQPTKEPLRTKQQQQKPLRLYRPKPVTLIDIYKGRVKPERIRLKLAVDVEALQKQLEDFSIDRENVNPNARRLAPKKLFA